MKSAVSSACSQMMQTKKQSHLEIMVNQIVGIILGWLIVRFVFPLFGVVTTNTDATISTGIFFVASYVRAYSIRRFFNERA